MDSSSVSVGLFGIQCLGFDDFREISVSHVGSTLQSDLTETEVRFGMLGGGYN